MRAGQKWDVALVGVGNIGTAFLRYKGFSKRGFSIKLVFDKDVSKVGTEIDKIKVRPIQEMGKFLKKHNVKIGIIAVPAEAAQEVADQMVAGGIKSILNFAPVSLKHPSEVSIKHIDIAIELEKLVYYLF